MIILELILPVPLRGQEKRVRLVDKFNDLRGQHAHSATPGSVLGKTWKNFTVK